VTPPDLLWAFPFERYIWAHDQDVFDPLTGWGVNRVVILQVASCYMVIRIVILVNCVTCVCKEVVQVCL
jgi:hypothetical protein